MRIKKYLSPAGALNKRYTDKDFEGTGWHYIPRSDIKPDDKLLDTALKLGEEYYLAGEDGYLLPSNTVNNFLKSKGLTTAYDYYYDQLNLSPFTKNLNNYFTLQYNANDRIGQLMRLRAADRKANQLTPGAGTFVVAPVAATLAGIGGATLAPWLTSALATPTGQALMYGTLGGELLNGASQLGGYNNFGHLIYNAGGGENWRSLPEWQKTLWNFTNPGYLISGPTSKAVDLTVEGLQRAATNTVKSSIVSDATKTAVNDYARNMLGIDPSLLTYTIKSETAPYILPYYMNRALNTNMPKPKGYEEYKIPGIVIDLINENLAGTTYRTQKDIDKVNQILKNIKYRLWDSERGYADNVDKYSYGVFDNSPLFGRYGRILISGGLLGRDHRRVLRHEVDHLVDLTITGTSKEYRKMLKEAFPEVQEIERNQLKGDIRDVILQEHNLNNASDEARRDFILDRKLLSDEELAEYITTVGYGNEIPRSALTPHRLTQIRRLLAGYDVYPSVKLPPKSNIINGVKTEMREIPTFTGNSFIKGLELSEREKLLQQVRDLNSLVQGKDVFEVFGTPLYKEAEKLIKQINESEHPIDLPLNWSSKNWFASRPKGLEPTAEEIAEFEANIPEYLEIQKNAGENWLKMPDGSIWQGDPREWVMMLSKAYKDFMKDSKFTTPMTHLMSDFRGDRVLEVPSTGAGRLWGNGFYGYINPTGKLNTSVSTTSSTYPIVAAEPQSTFVVNAKNPITLSYKDLTPRVLDLNSRHSTDRVGSFHNLSFEGSGPYLENDIGIAPKGKAVIGFPNDQGIAYPLLKFVTGNTGRFSKDSNSSLFRSILPFILGGSALYGITSNRKGGKLIPRKYKQNGN